MLQKNTVHLGDCLEVMKHIDDHSIDMILCDLPYGITGCKWDTPIDLDKLWIEYGRLIKKNGAIVLTANNPFASTLIMSKPKWFRHELVWSKSNHSNPMLAKKMPLKIHELILIFGKESVLYNPQGLIEINRNTRQGAKRSENIRGGRRPINYFQKFSNYPKSIQYFKLDPAGIHSTQKPVALFEWLIKTYSNEGDLILDNCSGSGTTAIAAINAKRDYICIEKDENYYNKSLERISKERISNE
jgi:site-specific DNA-methyltransferase (adenine-specific)